MLQNLSKISNLSFVKIKLAPGPENKHNFYKLFLIITSSSHLKNLTFLVPQTIYLIVYTYFIFEIVINTLTLSLRLENKNTTTSTKENMNPSQVSFIYFWRHTFGQQKKKSPKRHSIWRLAIQSVILWRKCGCCNFISFPGERKEGEAGRMVNKQRYPMTGWLAWWLLGTLLLLFFFGSVLFYIQKEKELCVFFFFLVSLLLLSELACWGKWRVGFSFFLFYIFLSLVFLCDFFFFESPFPRPLLVRT